MTTTREGAGDKGARPREKRIRKGKRLVGHHVTWLPDKGVAPACVDSTGASFGRRAGWERFPFYFTYAGFRQRL